MTKHKFKITPFTNPSGTEVFRLSGTFNGKRIRENYSTREEAKNARQDYEIKHLNNEPEGRTLWTTLSPEENRDAVAAMSMLKAQASEYSLTFAVDYFLRNFRPPEREKDAQTAAQEYLDQRDRDAVRGFISDLQFKAIRSEMNWFKMVFGEQPVSSISIDAYRSYLEKPKQQPRSRRTPPRVTSLKTWNNRRGLLNTFCLFCVEKGYLAENPMVKIPKHKISKSRATAETLTADQVKALMKFLETYTGPPERKNTAAQPKGFLVPFFALALFAGVRPDWKHGEISKLQSSDIDFSTNIIRIEPRTSKVNEHRTIKIQPNLRAWLERYPLDQYPQIPPKNVDRILREVRQEFSLGHDVLRHTFISMTVGAFRSIGDAALQAGNSEAVIRKHYLDLKSVEEADAFWAIVPEGEKLPAMEKKDGRYVLKSQEAKK
ncbi:hypothetical protein SH580_17685 [Coraliomargarita algicola]|uniref:Tyr recombinase domain-containing protein n=1 Tax=Coraliomargarita algicola TaxID=3092156 RepID=A0ABZ0RK08_9BACT|nr:hypothetical protein [Coraliomargarita sp. J2-16]WPJ95257.1 hypothetical protein SH580_17685 [Coraliomargarita sp. J2-16]